MTDLELLRDAMVNNPEEDTPRSMYVDELMQRAGCDRKEAETSMRVWWVPALQENHIGQAVKLVTGTNAAARRIQWCINKALTPGTQLNTRILVTSGYLKPTTNVSEEMWRRVIQQEPRTTDVSNQTGAQITDMPTHQFVLVGAMWVLLVAWEWKILDREPTAEPEDEHCGE